MRIKEKPNSCDTSRDTPQAAQGPLGTGTIRDDTNDNHGDSQGGKQSGHPRNLPTKPVTCMERRRVLQSYPFALLLRAKYSLTKQQDKVLRTESTLKRRSFPNRRLCPWNYMLGCMRKLKPFTHTILPSSKDSGMKELNVKRNVYMKAGCFHTMVC
jgi:hypothetical protein